MSKAGVQAESHVFLDQLDLNVTGPIVAMVCRKWDINAVSGRYLSTDFVISDARVSCKLPFIIEFHGGTTVRRSLVKSDGFVRHPFDFIDFDDLADVVGYITNVGRIIQQKLGSRILDFFLTNQRGQSIRVTLWGSLGDVLIDKKTKNAGLHAVVLTDVNAKLADKLYLSSSSSTMILDDDEIPALKEFKSFVSGDNSEARDGTLDNLLIWARNRKHEFVTFNFKVRIDDIMTRKGWNYPSCGSDKCRKGITRKDGKFWCDSCNKPTDYPMMRYRLELVVSDETAQTMVVVFDDLSNQLVKCSAESLLKEENEGAEDQPALPQALTNIIGTSHTFELKSHTFFEHGTYESFTYWHICEPVPAAETAGTGTVSAIADAGKAALKILTKDPTLCTPLKISEDKRKQSFANADSDAEITPAESEVLEDNDDGEPATKKKKKRS